MLIILQGNTEQHQITLIAVDWLIILQGNTEQHQITLIAQLCGTITKEIWEDVDKLELFNKMEIPKVNNVHFTCY
jgi:hypothetical protein